MTTFKLIFSEKDIRRLTTENIPTYEEFTSLLLSLYPHFHTELSIKYTDLEGDKVSVSSQIEWEEMLQELSGENLVRLFIESGPNESKYFKDGPQPEAVYFYDDVINKIPLEVNEFIEKFQDAVPKCLENLFRDGKIIPNNIPTFLNDAIKPKYVGEQVVDLDIDIYKLFDLLEQQSLRCLESLDKNVIQKGKEYLISMLQLKPDYYISLYNLACAEALLENIPEAIKTLERAIENGYKNLEHMIKDKDLDNIKNTEAFAQLVEKLRIMIGIESQHDIPIIESVDVPQIIDDDAPVVLSCDSTILDNSSILDNSTIKIDSINSSLSESLFDLRMKWGSQLNTLKSMGFLCDDEVLSLILEQVNGNLDEAMTILLQQSSK